MKSRKKQNVYFIGGSILVVVLLISLVFANRKGSYSLSDELGISITCPEKVTIGGEVTCIIGLINPENDTILSINANYDLPEELTYKSYDDSSTCTGNNCFETLTKTENGFAVINTNGVTTSTAVGELTLNIDEEATSNTQYTITLTNIELCDGEYEMHSVEDIEVEVTTSSNNATLSNITISEATITQNFNPTLEKYTAIVADAVDTVDLVLTKSDAGATISGITEDLDLHYGTNTFIISVTSEDESETINYTIEIIRKYEFSTGSYTYNAAANYIYTKNDTGNAIISNLAEAPENISYHINNNILVIKYLNDEVLDNIDILNFTSNYTINNNNLYIDNDSTTLAQFKAAVTSSTVTIKVFNDSGNEVTNNAATIGQDYKLDIYYNDLQLDTYNINLQYLSIDNSLIVDSETSIIKRLPLEMTFGELKAKIETSGTITLETDATVNNDYKLRTGDILKITLNNETITYKISVLGCLDNSTDVAMADIIKVYRYMKGRINLTQEQVAAADIINDGQIELNDVIRLYLYYKNKINELEGNE